MQRPISGKFAWNFILALFFLLYLVTASRAQAQNLKQNLQYFAECQSGPCDIYKGGTRDPFGYRSKMFGAESEAKAKAVGDYLEINGWDTPQIQSVWRTRCEKAKVETFPVTYYPFPQQWSGRVNFTHQCYSYRPDGLSPPSVPAPYVRSILIRGVCRPGFVVKDYDTGECWRVPNACPGYPENSTFGCGESVAELQATQKNLFDPRRLFHAQQTCIAKKSCELRCQMDNCQWMDLVIPAFARPYLDDDGSWPIVEASCGEMQVLLIAVPGGKWIADRECFSSMGWYHVQVDLKKALEAHGCGTQQDWDLVGKQIAPCLLTTNPGYPNQYYEFGGVFVRLARERVRSQCLANRKSRGLPIDINSGFGGKVCQAGT
ncbi:hypothetical protein [Xanthomonas oryzae]|uniref:hypothetical protein n=1 Tax=Xanthomonas oryzae TaxID=347 RepID=UPI000A8D288B|nr:hypothetical protein [Xanthomonas oryzae]QBG93821.1 hypothetical protein EYR26_23165 [Xanthomonas oryzae]